MVKYEIIRSRPGTVIDVYTLEFTGQVMFHLRLQRCS